MSRRIRPLSFFLFASDLVQVSLGLLVASKLRTVLPFGRGGPLNEPQVEVPWFVYALAIGSWAIGLISSGAYDPQLSLRWFNEAWRVALGSTLGTGLMAGTLFMTYRELSRLQFVYFFAVSLSLLLAYRAVLRSYYRVVGKARPGGRSRVLIVGAGELGDRVAKVILDHSRWGFEAVGFLDDNPEKQSARVQDLPVLGTIEDLRGVVEARAVTEVLIALPARAHQRITEVVAALERLPVRIKVVPDYFSLALVRANAEILGGIPIIGLRDPLIEGVPRLIKRGFDLVVTVLLIVLFLPFMFLIAIAIRLDSRGPVWLRQQRVGENGRIFEMFKFRTMVAGTEQLAQAVTAADSEGHPVHKRRSDPRVTRVGQVLRRFSLDELPQLLNVLKGEMSLVGPRPEMPWLVEKYESWQRKRFAVPQGLTGWWQINGRSDKPMHLNTDDDLYYVYNYSLLLDMLILLRTPLAVLRGQGAF